MTAAPVQGQDFSITISVDQAPSEAFEAIVNPRGWWSRTSKAAPARSARSSPSATRTPTSARSASPNSSPGSGSPGS